MQNNPKASVLQEIMALMDEQMMGRAKAKKPQDLPVETTNVTIGEAPAAKPEAEDEGIDQEMLQRLIEMQKREEDEQVLPPNNIAGSN